MGQGLTGIVVVFVECLVKTVLSGDFGEAVTEEVVEPFHFLSMADEPEDPKYLAWFRQWRLAFPLASPVTWAEEEVLQADYGWVLLEEGQNFLFQALDLSVLVAAH